MPKHITLTTLAAIAVLSMGSQMAQAYAPEGDLLKIKGYSPEVIEATDSQRSRQEWRQPAAPKLNPVEKFMHNIYYGDWTGGVDDFGSQIIRDR